MHQWGNSNQWTQLYCHPWEEKRREDLNIWLASPPRLTLTSTVTLLGPSPLCSLPTAFPPALTPHLLFALTYFHINKTCLISIPSWLALHFLHLYTQRLSSLSPLLFPLICWLLSRLFISLFPAAPPSVHSCGRSPQAVMQSSDSCAQSQGLELEHQPSRGVTTPHSVGKQRRRKEGRWGDERKEGMKPMREEVKTARHCVSSGW